MRFATPLVRTDLIDELARFVAENPRLFVLTGAGCSTESGIPDYRDSEGQWRHAPPVFYRDFVGTESVRRSYWARSLVGWRRFARARPNPAHEALAGLEAAGFVRQLVTQNVDRLHQEAGSRRVIDLHGRLDTVECLDCHRQVSRAELQQVLEALNPGFQAPSAVTAPDGDAAPEQLQLDGFRVPPCRHCGGTLKPAVVFFGECVPRQTVDLAFARLEEANAVLVVGSSLMVYSAYRFCRAALAQAKPLAAVNLGRTRADGELTLKVPTSCAVVLPELARRLGAS